MTALIRSVRCVALAGLTLALTGCDVLIGIITPTTVTVSLVNASDYDVDAKIFISDEQGLPEFLLTELASEIHIGDELDFVIPAGETATFTRSCDKLQAIVVDDADLLVLVGLGPEAGSDVLRDGDDFRCGDIIIFTFSHSQAMLDFHITTLVQ